MSNGDQELQQGIAAYKAGEREQAVRLFSQAAQMNPQNQVAWLWLGSCLDDNQKKRQCLEYARDLNPQNDIGQRAIQILATIPSQPPDAALIPRPTPLPAPPQPAPPVNPGTTMHATYTVEQPREQPRSRERVGHSEAETIIHKTRQHWLIFIIPSIISGFLCLFVLSAATQDLPTLFCSIGIMPLPFFIPIMQYLSTELVITSKRILWKQGILRRTSLELLLTKVESIYVDQSLMERIFNAGTIKVIGSGGTQSSFRRIPNASSVHSIVQQQISDAQDRRW